MKTKMGQVALISLLACTMTTATTWSHKHKKTVTGATGTGKAESGGTGSGTGKVETGGTGSGKAVTKTVKWTKVTDKREIQLWKNYQNDTLLMRNIELIAAPGTGEEKPGSTLRNTIAADIQALKKTSNWAQFQDQTTLNTNNNPNQTVAQHQTWEINTIKEILDTP